MSAYISTLTVKDIVPFGPGGSTGRFFALRLSKPDWPACEAGQFVMIRPENWGLDLPWPRPLSICLLNSELVLFFQVVGRGTNKLQELRPDDKVKVFGPLGTHFETDPDVPTLLLAGGVGIAPFVHYAATHPSPWSLKLFFAHRIPLECYPYESFPSSVSVEHFQEHGPADLARMLSKIDGQIRSYAEKRGLVLACGPKPFLQEIQKKCAYYNVRAQLSLEERMACGVGACLGCVIKPLLDPETGKNQSKRKLPPALQDGQPVPTCTCGPVFWSDSIDLG